MASAARRRLGHTLRVSGSRRVRRDGLAGGAAPPVAGRRVSRGESVEEHRAAGPAPAVAGRRARARSPGDGPAAAGRGADLLRDPGDRARRQRRGGPPRLSRDQGHLRLGLAGDPGPLRGARAGGAARPGQRRARHAVRARSPAPLRPGAARGGSGARRACGGQRRPAAGRAASAQRRNAPRPPTPPSIPTPRSPASICRKVRQTRGIELSDISQRTKISERYLRAIEEERFSEMPAAVYVRGYVAGVRAGAAHGRAPGDGELPGAVPQEHGRTGARRGPLTGPGRGSSKARASQSRQSGRVQSASPDPRFREQAGSGGGEETVRWSPTSSVGETGPGARRDERVALPALAGRLLSPEAPPAVGAPLPGRAARYRRGQRHLLFPHPSPDLCGLAKVRPRRIHLRGQGQPVHHPHAQASKLRAPVGELLCLGPPASRHLAGTDSLAASAAALLGRGARAGVLRRAPARRRQRRAMGPPTRPEDHRSLGAPRGGRTGGSSSATPSESGIRPGCLPTRSRCSGR